jgi:hypothetical protein
MSFFKRKEKKRKKKLAYLSLIPINFVLVSKFIFKKKRIFRILDADQLNFIY